MLWELFAVSLWEKYTLLELVKTLSNLGNRIHFTLLWNKQISSQSFGRFFILTLLQLPEWVLLRIYQQWNESSETRKWMPLTSMCPSGTPHELDLNQSSYLPFSSREGGPLYPTAQVEWNRTRHPSHLSVRYFALAL